ncbi:hypothetical protein ACK2M7_01710 [Chryseobacterium sp. TY4]
MGKVFVRIVIGYKEIFGNADINLLDLVKGYDPDTMIMLIANVNFRLFRKHKDQEILEAYFFKERFHPDQLKVIKSIQSEHILLFNEKTNDHFLQLIFENYDWLLENKNGKGLFMDFLKCYLKINESAFGEDKTDFSSINTEFFEEFSQILFFSKVYEFQRGKNITFQILKIKSLLNYYYVNYPEILLKFYELNKIENPDLWVGEILLFLTQQDKNAYHLFDVNNSIISEYFEKISINKILNKKIGNKELKCHPIFKVNTDFLILNWNHFFIGLYHSIDFDLFQLYTNIEKKTIYPDYKSIISKKVSEEIMFRYIIKKLIKSKASYTTLVFDEKKEGFPDCYLRIGNRVFLFEFKDYIATSEFLYSYDFSEIETFISNNFIEKGVAQLANFINGFEKFDKKFDSKIHQKIINLKDIEIIPILVVSEEFFATPPLESLLTKTLTLKIKENIKNFKKVHKFVLLSTEELVNFITGNNRDDFFKLIFKYSKNKKVLKTPPSFKQFPDFKYPINKSYKSDLLLEIFNELPNSEKKITG